MLHDRSQGPFSHVRSGRKAPRGLNPADRRSADLQARPGSWATVRRRPRGTSSSGSLGRERATRNKLRATHTLCFARTEVFWGGRSQGDHGAVRTPPVFQVEVQIENSVTVFASPRCDLHSRHHSAGDRRQHDPHTTWRAQEGTTTCLDDHRGFKTEIFRMLRNG